MTLGTNFRSPGAVAAETMEENRERCDRNVAAQAALGNLSVETGLSFGEVARQLGLATGDDVGRNYTEVMTGPERGLRIDLAGAW